MLVLAHPTSTLALSNNLVAATALSKVVVLEVRKESPVLRGIISSLLHQLLLDLLGKGDPLRERLTRLLDVLQRIVASGSSYFLENRVHLLVVCVDIFGQSLSKLVFGFEVGEVLLVILDAIRRTVLLAVLRRVRQRDARGMVEGRYVAHVGSVWGKLVGGFVLCGKLCESSSSV